MQINRFNIEEPTAAQQQAFERLQVMVNHALADGRLSRSERDQIMAAIYADHKVTVAECELLRTLEEKIAQGDIYIES